MSGRLILLPKKSYTPWNTQTTERVLRDERLAHESEQRHRRDKARRDRLEWIRSETVGGEGTVGGDGDTNGDGRRDEIGEELWPDPTTQPSTTNGVTRTRGGNGIHPVFLTSTSNHNHNHNHDGVGDGRHPSESNRKRRRRHRGTQPRWNVTDIHGASGNHQHSYTETEVETDQRRKFQLDPMAAFVPNSNGTNINGVDSNRDCAVGDSNPPINPVRCNDEHRIDPEITNGESGGRGSRDRNDGSRSAPNERESKRTEYSVRKRQNESESENDSSSSSSSRTAPRNKHPKRHHHHHQHHRRHHNQNRNRNRHRHPSKRTKRSTTHTHRRDEHTTDRTKRRNQQTVPPSSSSSSLSNLQEMERRLRLREKEEMEREERVRNGGAGIRRGY